MTDRATEPVTARRVREGPMRTVAHAESTQRPLNWAT